MRILSFFLILLFSSNSSANDLDKCGAFIKSEGDNIHDYQPCLSLANGGHVGAQYSVAMSFEKANESDLALHYYLRAANKGFAPAILGLAHMYNETHPWKAIYWYQRYFETGEEGSGYAAKLIANIFQRLELIDQTEYWVKQCLTTEYSGCNVESK